jgi:hypothetical protein
MDLTALSQTVLVDRLVVLENAAAHATAMAAVADAYAYRAREQADAAQRLLSEVKVWLALLPDDCRLELRAPKPASASPAELLGVRPHLPVPRPDRGIPPCRDRTTSARPAVEPSHPASPAHHGSDEQMFGAK